MPRFLSYSFAHPFLRYLFLPLLDEAAAINAELKKKLDERDNELIEAAFPEAIQALLKRKLNGEERRPYPESLKQFANAMTVNFYSPKAYEYLRTVLPLPHKDTLRSWTKKVEVEP